MHGYREFPDLPARRPVLVRLPKWTTIIRTFVTLGNHTVDLNSDNLFFGSVEGGLAVLWDYADRHLGGPHRLNDLSPKHFLSLASYASCGRHWFGRCQ